MVIKLQQICKSFPRSDFQLRDISFEIASNEVVGLVGRNGTGKSTILKMMNGIVPVDSGEILFENESITSMSPAQLRSMRKKVCYIFQDANLLRNKTVLYHLRLVYKLNQEKPNQEKIEEVLDFMGISALKNQICKNLSGGQQQKVAIAMALLSEPQVLLCDEISSALDTNSEKEIFSLLEKLKAEKEIAIVMISHNLSLIKNFCDRVLFLENGGIGRTVYPNRQQENRETEDYYEYVEEFLVQ